MTQTHTQGPWEVVEANEHHGYFIEDPQGNTVADLYFKDGNIFHHPWNIKAQAEANATLMAAAPETAEERDKLKEINADLFNALDGCLSQMEMMRAELELHDRNVPNGEFNRGYNVLEKARTKYMCPMGIVDTELDKE